VEGDKVRGGRRTGKVRRGRDLQDLHLPSSKVGIGESSHSQILFLGKLEYTRPKLAKSGGRKPVSMATNDFVHTSTTSLSISSDMLDVGFYARSLLTA
jgi:hypothetical protein